MGQIKKKNQERKSKNDYDDCNGRISNECNK